MRFRFSTFAMVIGCLGALYLLSAYQRVSPDCLAAGGEWPRPFPYPDGWLLALNEYYFNQHPGPPGVIRVHGELPRVRETVLIGIGAFIAIFAAGLFARMHQSRDACMRAGGTGEQLQSPPETRSG